MTDWGHDELAEDLRRSREQSNRIAVTKLSLGGWGLAGQMDVACMGKSRKKHKIAPTCWEVKVSRSDFRSDVTKGKYERYLPFVSRLYFATPSGMVRREEIPPRMGWATRNENGWSVIKAPTMSHPSNEGFLDFMVAFLLNRQKSPWKREYSRKERAEALDKDNLEDFYRHWPSTGQKVAERLEEAATAQRRHRQARNRLMSRLDDAGVEYSEDWRLSRMVKALLKARPQKAPDGILRTVQNIRGGLERQVDRLRELEDPA